MRRNDKRLKSPNSAWARDLRIGALTAAIAGLLEIGVSGEGELSPTLVHAALAGKHADGGYRAGYLPAEFPVPNGEIEPSIETS